MSPDGAMILRRSEVFKAGTPDRPRSLKPDKLKVMNIYMGVSEKVGVPYFGVLIIRVLLFRVLS